MSKKEMDFEKSFARLEQILDRMNSNNVTLEESLKLYEEADALITGCSELLRKAETKIEMLIKTRNGDLELDGNENPKTREFQLEPLATT